MHGSSLPALSGSAPPLAHKGSQGGLGAPWRSCPALLQSPASGILAGSDLALSRGTAPFPEPCDLSTAAAHGLRECWLFSGWALVLLSRAGKIGVPSPSPSWAVGSCKLISVQISEQPPPPQRSAFLLVAAAHEAPCWSTCQCLTRNPLPETPDTFPRDAWPSKGPRHGTLTPWLSTVFVRLPWTSEPRAWPKDQDGS